VCSFSSSNFRLVYAGNNLAKAQGIFAQAIKRRPRI
jgi:hypothetical protein